MLYISLGPLGSKSGEVVTYNGLGWIDHRDILYVHNFAEDDTVAEIGAYSNGYDEDVTELHLNYPFIRLYMEQADWNHKFRWNSPSGGAAEMWLQPDPYDGDEGKAHVVVITDGSGTSELYLELRGSQSLMLQYDGSHIGMKLIEDVLAPPPLEIQWESAEAELSVEMFKNAATNYAGVDINDDHKLYVYGSSHLEGTVSVGNEFATKHYELADERPAADTQYRFMLWNAGTMLEWWKLKPDLVTPVTLPVTVTPDAVNKLLQLGITYAEVTVVTDVFVDGLEFKQTKKALKVLAAAASVDSVWATGTECP